MELSSRFSRATFIAKKTLHLLPCHVQHLQKEDEVVTENFFSGDLSSPYSFKPANTYSLEKRMARGNKSIINYRKHLN